MYKKVSVVIPTIGRLTYLDQSIQSLLNQTVPFNEIIVFDNSVEQNIRELSSFENHSKIKWANSGKQLDAIQSWNTAVSLCCNEYVTIFGDDDLALEYFHEEIQTTLKRSDFTILPFATINSEGLLLGNNSNHFSDMSSVDLRHLRIKGKLGLMIPGVVFKKKDFELCDGFVDSELPGFLYSDDLLWFKLSALKSIVASSEKICWHYRIHADQICNININDLKLFNRNAIKYTNKLVISLGEIGISGNKILPSNMTSIDYIDTLISSRFFIILSKLKSAKKLDIQSGFKNYYEFLSSPATIKNKIITTCKLIKIITFYLFKRIKRVQ